MIIPYFEINIIQSTPRQKPPNPYEVALASSFGATEPA